MSGPCRETLKQAHADLASATRREQELRRTLEQKEKRLADIEASTEDTQEKVCCSQSQLSHSLGSRRFRPLAFCPLQDAYFSCAMPTQYAGVVCALSKQKHATDCR